MFLRSDIHLFQNGSQPKDDSTIHGCFLFKQQNAHPSLYCETSTMENEEQETKSLGARGVTSCDKMDKISHQLYYPSSRHPHTQDKIKRFKNVCVYMVKRIATTQPRRSTYKLHLNGRECGWLKPSILGDAIIQSKYYIIIPFSRVA